VSHGEERGTGRIAGADRRCAGGQHRRYRLAHRRGRGHAPQLCVNLSTQAFADVQSYCEVYGQDFANGKTSDVDAWADHFRNAFGDCMIRYAAEAVRDRTLPLTAS
jgi:hypothetical protein